MNKDALVSLIVKILLMVLSPLAVKLHLDGSVVAAVTTDLVDAGVLIYGVWSHWNMVKTPVASAPVQAASIARGPGSTAAVILLLILCSFMLSACATCPGCSFGQRFQANLTAANAFANKYGPIIGKDLLMVGNIIVQAECSPALVPATATAINLANSPKLLQITGATLSDASRVTSILSANQDIADTLCPLVIAIKAQVGAVPPGTPSQVIVPVTP